MKQFSVLAEENQRYPMGLTITEKRLHVSVIGAVESCSLVLYENGETEPSQKIAFDPAMRQGEVWNLTLEAERKWPKGILYCFEMDGVLKPDPCGRQFRGWESWGEPENIKKELKSPLISDSYDWEGDRPLEIPYHDSVIYRCHVRGFTCHHSSKVRNKGTFRAVMDKIPYMKELGITALELMPVVEFQEIMVREREWNPRAAKGPEPTGKLNYWGYTGGFGYAPKAAYASGREKNPVRELKDLVKALHKAGIELILELYFDGKESPAAALDLVRFWVQEYHLDGVHLVGYAPAELIGRDPYLSRTKIFASGWNGVDGGQRKHLAEYNEGFLIDMRRVLKGDEDQMRSLMFRVSNNPKEYGTINYMANTNGMTMMDMVSYDQKHNEANGEDGQDGTNYNYSWNCGVEGPTKKKKITELRRRQIRNAMLLLFLSQGTPLLMAGDEFGNSKSGNNNSYCQDNEISWLNWNLLRSNQDIYEFTRFVISFRKAHPVFHMEKQPQMMDYRASGCPDVSYHGEKAWRPEFENFRRQLGVLYCGDYGKKDDGSSDDYFYVMYNMHWESHEFGLPRLPKNRRWHVAIDSYGSGGQGYHEAGEEPVLEDQKTCVVEGRSIVVLIGKTWKEEVKKENDEEV